MTSPEQKLEAEIQHALQDYLRATQQSAQAIVLRALANIAPKPKKASRSTPQKQPSSKAPPRDPAVIQALQDQMLQIIKRTPGQTIGQIAQQMEAKTRDLSQPARKLRLQGHIRVVGRRLNATYFPKAPKKKAS